MNSTQHTTEIISPATLLVRVGQLRHQGWRLSAISSARAGEVLELIYSFDRDYILLNLRMELPADNARVPSISSHYFCAVLYENEIHDLFGLQVSDMAVDFKGNLYKTAVKFPFGSTKAPSAASASKAPTPVVSAATPQTATLPAAS